MVRRKDPRKREYGEGAGHDIFGSRTADRTRQRVQAERAREQLLVEDKQLAVLNYIAERMRELVIAQQETNRLLNELAKRKP